MNKHVPVMEPRAVSGSYPDDNPKTVFGVAKPPMSPVPPVALVQLGLAMANGRDKYGLFNWRNKQVSASVYYDAAMRHLFRWWEGEEFDPESGVHHLAHVMACCSIVLDARAQGCINNDRPTPSICPEAIAGLTPLNGAAEK